MKIKALNILKLMRPKHYIKNVFIFSPLFFAGKLFNLDLMILAILGFIAFSLSASAIYILNDYFDIEADKNHPTKQHRPLASGAVSKNIALILFSCLLAIGLGVMALISKNAMLVLSIYIVMNIAYSLYLKNLPIIDITIIAIGFVLRLVVGAALTETPLSMWIVIMTFLLALFLALAKRRDDVLLFNQTGRKMRNVINGYNLKFIDTTMTIMCSVVIVCYIMFTISVEVVERMHSEHLYLTSLFVILGVMRYLQITLVNKNSGSPTQVLIKDRVIQLVMLGWISSFFWIIYS